MKIAIIGSRTIAIRGIEEYLPEGVTEIVSGGALGVDKAAARFARMHGIKLIEFLPDHASGQRVTFLVIIFHNGSDHLQHGLQVVFLIGVVLQDKGEFFVVSRVLRDLLCLVIQLRGGREDNIFLADVGFNVIVKKFFVFVIHFLAFRKNRYMIL